MSALRDKAFEVSAELIADMIPKHMADRSFRRAAVEVSSNIIRSKVEQAMEMLTYEVTLRGLSKDAANAAFDHVVTILNKNERRGDA